MHRKGVHFGAGKEHPFRSDDNRDDLSLCGYQIVLFEIWRDISVWVSTTGAKLEKTPPWKMESPYYILSKNWMPLKNNYQRI